ncbi:MAG: hypothetical protein AB8H80_03550 [Planctomycetota bacterium]
MIERSARILALAAALPCNAALAQTVPSEYATATEELPQSMASPFATSGRSHQYLTAAALGLPNGATVTLQSLALRFDGPTTSSGTLPQVLSSLAIRIGTTERSIQSIGAVFDENLSQPLQTVFSDSNYSMPIDSSVTTTGQPELFGGAGNALNFAFANPATLTVPLGGCIVIEFDVVTAAGSSDDSRVDFGRARVLGSLATGRAFSNGRGCAAPALGPRPQLDTSGAYEIGTAFSLSGVEFPANAVGATWWTEQLMPQLAIPGTPNCWLYLEMATGGLLMPHVFDAAGTFGGDPPIPIPPAPRLAGSLIYLQTAATTAPSATNPTGIVTSNYRTIAIGGRPANGVQSWYLQGPAALPGLPSQTVATATVTTGGSLALQLQ